MSDTAQAKKSEDAAKTSAKTDSSPNTTKLPGAGDFSATAFKADAASDDDHERNAVFESLVTGDEDIVGLVAYSIYKQNKHDWLVAFNKAKGREPDEAEAASYIIGESTPRRLAIYCHLAQATLDGHGPQVGGAASGEKFAQRNRGNAAKANNVPASSSSGGKMLAFGLGVVVTGVLAYFATRFGVGGLGR